mgnify:FL=1
MKKLEITFGRLGNKLFQYAFLYAESRRRGIDFYFQDPKFFEGYEEEIKQMFGDGIGYLEQVGIHVRRGANPTNPDEPKYSDNPFYVDLISTSYYTDAMKLFPGRKFLVFSDDISFCKEYFKENENVQVMEGGTELEDFNTLASCDGIIGANSSFSYWAAYLNPNPAAKIVFPSVKNWYSDGVERTKCPESWIRI